MPTSEWVEFHQRYAEDGALTERLRWVREFLGKALENGPPGPRRAISLCAGDGRDLLEVLAVHPRGRDVRARLVDLDPELVAAGRDRIRRNGLSGAEFVQGDASSTDALAGAVPADLVLLCGIFGNITDADVRNTIDHLPEVCASGAAVIWTRGRFPPDLTPSIRAWFVAAGFEEVSFVAIPDSTLSVGASRYSGTPRGFRPGVRLFTFLPRGERPSSKSRTPGAAADSPARS
jgi:hypothetical protein